jgi:hypothetical protein
VPSNASSSTASSSTAGRCAASAPARAALVIDSDADLSDPAVADRLRLLSRYRRDLERAYDRALKELERRQTRRAVLLQQECEAISKVFQITPMASLTDITRITDPFFRITRVVAQSREAREKRDEPKAPVVLPLNQEELAMYCEPDYLAALK